MRLGAIILSALAALAPAVSAQTQAPTTRITNCTTSGCHAQEVNHKFLHGPTAVQACDICHEFVDPAKHTFVLKRQGAALCEFCHIDKTGREGPFVHEPVAKGNCTGCHDPHGSNTRQMLKKDTVVQMCTQCHAATLSGSHVHKPASEDCTACHQAHTSAHKNLLIMESRALCLSCHADVGKTAETSAFPHKPAAEGDCLQCHTPHASDHIRELKEDPAKLCTSCHTDVAHTIASATFPHAALTDERSCLNCHTPHGSEHAKQLYKDPVAACLECHKKPIKVDKDHTVAGVPELALPSMHPHGPIKDGDCSACHEVHGGQQTNLLVQPFAAGIYQAYSADSYALCFKCHDKRLAESEVTTDATNFRDGSRNLHWVHVAKSPQGRSCRACHTVHASKFPEQIADTVPYGEWKLPINYKQTPNGGSCAPGCHKAETYDRGGPVTPATEPEPAPAGDPADKTAPSPK